MKNSSWIFEVWIAKRISLAINQIRELIFTLTSSITRDTKNKSLDLKHTNIKVRTRDLGDCNHIGSCAKILYLLIRIFGFADLLVGKSHGVIKA